MVMDMGQEGRQHTVELDYRLTRRDILRGVRFRERRRRLDLVRWAVMAMFLAFAGLIAIGPHPSAGSSITMILCAAGFWSLPHIQAHHAWRTIFWQGDYHTSVSEAGITTRTEYTTLMQRWSVFRGFRETRDHVVLLSRDRNNLLVEVLPKRGLSTPHDAERLSALLAEHLPRI
ncbi:YcxB family protein [Streptomyces sp. A7024]|uniref:YcxB family protein n=1 Tax=Streptomyces coryli TaxID=1128680 RepID=A0A6G4UA58_9ACTN|nr:YcxB family protein [Streptomyces coryli]NGN68268.1 YcxB family protein [Streptomyces coryli]